jgi:UPF0716 family protein affecting phage T7 exclusion
MKPMVVKVLGAAMLLLAAVGSLSGWSAVRTADDGVVYLLANIVLSIAGVLTVFIGYRLGRKHSSGAK